MIINQSLPCFDVAILHVGDIYKITDVAGEHIVALRNISKERISGEERKVIGTDLIISNYQIDADKVLSSLLIYEEV